MGKDQMVQRVRKFIEQVGERFGPYLEGDLNSLPDEEMMKIIGKIMDDCKLSFTTFIVKE